MPFASLAPPRSPGRRIALIAVSLMACLVPAGASAQEPASPPEPEAPAAEPAPAPQPERDPRVDTETGRDVRVWPPDVLFDHKHLRLEMTIPDMTEARFSAVQTLELEAVAVPRRGITLDAGKGLSFSAASIDGRAVGFAHDKEAAKLAITFSTPAVPGRAVTLRLIYDAENPGGRGSGLTWSKDDPRTPEFDPMLHAQGEPQNNHLWYACHDFPNERLTTELIVTVPAPYEAVSNGRLLGVRHDPSAAAPALPPDTVPDDEAAEGGESPAEAALSTPAPALPRPTGTSTFHWLQDKPHVNYLVTLAVGRFDVVNVGGPESERPGLWMPVYGPLGSGEALRRSFGNTPEMVRHFSELFDYPYPWDKYAQIICRNFAAGAMENTSATTFASGFGRGGRRGSIDGIIAHELVHQWFGDVVTCRSWEHLWLNEGWATMGEALWAEHKEGQDGYQAAILGNFRSERGGTRTRSWPRHAGMVTNRYRDPNQRFTSADNVYQKGGAVLHMLRTRLGDDLFFKGARLYLKRHQFDQAETDDFRLAMEEVSGQSLERFFDQWCRRPGLPVLELDYSWQPDESGEGGTLSVTVEQTQRIDADNPAYAFQLPLYAGFAGEDEDATGGEYLYLLCDSTLTTATFRLAQKPRNMSVDPYLSVLCRSKVRQGLEAHVDTLRHAPTLAARLDAIAALSESAHPRALAALVAAALGSWPRSMGSTPHAMVARSAADAAAAVASAAAGRLSASVAATASRIADSLTPAPPTLAATDQHP